MKTKLPLLFMFVICSLSFSKIKAQTTVTIDANSNWVGYANVFDNGAYQFGNSWALDALKTIINIPQNSITLYPNFNTYNATDPYWSNGEIGNKTFEGNTFVENPALAGQTLTFTAQVATNTFASGYTVIAFIKGLNPANNYSTDVLVTTPLVAGNTFSITAPSIPAGLIVQYGFSVTGLNANPAQEAQLGNATVLPAALAVQEFDRVKISMFPNPVSDVLTIESKTEIDQISVYNLLGQQFVEIKGNSNTVNLNVSDLKTGTYMVKTVIDGHTAVDRFVKN